MFCLVGFYFVFFFFFFKQKTAYEMRISDWSSDVCSSDLKSTTVTTHTGGNVTGTYANANGTLNFGVNGNGSVNQLADQASSATVSGVIYGSLTSQAGSANSQSNSESKSVEVLSGGNGTRSLTSASSSSSTTNAGGESSVTVSGKLAEGEAGVVPSLSSYATGNSGVTLSGTVEGGIYSSASGTDVS